VGSRWSPGGELQQRQPGGRPCRQLAALAGQGQAKAGAVQAGGLRRLHHDRKQVSVRHDQARRCGLQLPGQLGEVFIGAAEDRCRRCRRGRDRPARACRRPRRPSRPDRRRSGTTSLRRCRRSGSPGSVSGSSIQPSNALPTSTASFACSCILKGSARIGRIPSLAGAGVTGRSLHRSLGVHPLVTGEAGGWPAHRSLLLIRVLDRLQEPPSTERLLLSRSCGQGSGHRPRALAAGIVSPGHQDHTGSRRDRG